VRVSPLAWGRPFKSMEWSYVVIAMPGKKKKKKQLVINHNQEGNGHGLQAGEHATVSVT
jgi:hypothetical protein